MKRAALFLFALVASFVALAWILGNRARAPEVPPVWPAFDAGPYPDQGPPPPTGDVFHDATMLGESIAAKIPIVGQVVALGEAALKVLPVSDDVKDFIRNPFVGQAKLVVNVIAPAALDAAKAVGGAVAGVASGVVSAVGSIFGGDSAQQLANARAVAENSLFNAGLAGATILDTDTYAGAGVAAVPAIHPAGPLGGPRRILN